MTTEKGIFGAGCFWGVETEFRAVPGVLDAIVGYSGGQTQNPTYREVCSKTTGHVEVVEVTFDPARVGYEQLVRQFFAMHDPTQMNRQGPDIGLQYRSVIFYTTPEQERIARAVLDELEASKRYPRPIATAIEPASVFYRAEEYHQQYFAKQGGH
jgi:peptide-methionine (S)-S-oxide reductase